MTTGVGRVYQGIEQLFSSAVPKQGYRRAPLVWPRISRRSAALFVATTVVCATNFARCPMRFPRRLSCG